MRKAILLGAIVGVGAICCSSSAEACWWRRNRAQVVYYYYPAPCYYPQPQIGGQGGNLETVTTLQNLPAPDLSEIHAADNLPKPKGVDEIMSDLKARGQQGSGATKP